MPPNSQNPYSNLPEQLDQPPANNPSPEVSTQPLQSQSPFGSPSQPAPIYDQAPNNVPLSQFTPPRRNKLLPGLLLVVLALVIVGGAGFAYWHSQQLSPDALFKDALESALSTKQVTQDTQLPSEGASQSTRYDLADIKNPKVSTDTKISSLEYQGYADLQNSYLAYKAFGTGDSASDKKLNPLVNTWFQIRKDGQVTSGELNPLLQDPYVNLFGDYIFGNFSTADRQRLVSYLLDSHVYKYNAKDVTKATLNGQQVFVYGITENAGALKAFNEKVGSIIGINMATVDSALDQAPPTDSAKLYINSKTHQLIKVEAKSVGITATVTYQYENLPSPPAAPGNPLPYATFNARLQALERS